MRKFINCCNHGIRCSRLYLTVIPLCLLVQQNASALDESIVEAYIFQQQAPEFEETEEPAPFPSDALLIVAVCEDSGELLMLLPQFVDTTGGCMLEYQRIGTIAQAGNSFPLDGIQYAASSSVWPSGEGLTLSIAQASVVSYALRDVQGILWVIRGIQTELTFSGVGTSESLSCFEPSGSAIRVAPQRAEKYSIGIASDGGGFESLVIFDLPEEARLTEVEVASIGSAAVLETSSGFRILEPPHQPTRDDGIRDCLATFFACCAPIEFNYAVSMILCNSPSIRDYVYSCGAYAAIGAVGGAVVGAVLGGTCGLGVGAVPGGECGAMIGGVVGCLVGFNRTSSDCAEEAARLCEAGVAGCDRQLDQCVRAVP
jgi:hypothetical protein